MSGKPITESRQIMRVSRVIESGGEKLDAVISDPYGNLPAWQDAFVAMARCVAKSFYPDMTAEEQDFNANVLLRKAAMSMKIDRVARQVTDPLKLHPGEAQVPDDVLEHENAVQAISVWVIPPEQCNECVEHEGRTFVGGETAAIPNEQLGTVLAGIAFQQTFLEAKGDEPARLKMVGDVMKTFIARFDTGTTKH